MSFFRVTRILKALGHPTRYHIMLVLAQGPKRWSRIAEEVFNDSIYYGRIAGKFQYHMQVLVKTGLIAQKNGMYELTRLGRRALRLAEELSGGSCWP